MNKFMMCFVFDSSGGYRPVPYSELTDNGERKPEYAERYFLPLHGYLMEVRHKDYISFYKNERRQLYIRERNNQLGILSFEALDCDYMLGEDILWDMYVDVEKEIMIDLMLKELRTALQQLDQEEYLLIRMIYFEDQTERQCAEVFKTNNINIHRRKIRILKKLKKIIDPDL